MRSKGLIAVNVTGADRLQLQAIWMGKLMGVAEKPEALIPAVRQAGKGVARNFDSESDGRGRKWQHLTYYTLFDRAEHGHMGKILDRSGQLRTAASSHMANWRAFGNAAGTYTKPYNEGDTLRFSGTLSSGNFHATLTGPRAQNQFGKAPAMGNFGALATADGNRRYGTGYLPRRPFWSFSSDTVNAMGKASMLYIMQEWQSESGGVATLHTGLASMMGGS